MKTVQRPSKSLHLKARFAPPLTANTVGPTDMGHVDPVVIDLLRWRHGH